MEAIVIKEKYVLYISSSTSFQVVSLTTVTLIL